MWKDINSLAHCDWRSENRRNSKLIMMSAPTNNATIFATPQHDVHFM